MLQYPCHSVLIINIASTSRYNNGSNHSLLQGILWSLLGACIRRKTLSTVIGRTLCAGHHYEQACHTSSRVSYRSSGKN